MRTALVQVVDAHILLDLPDRSARNVVGATSHECCCQAVSRLIVGAEHGQTSRVAFENAPIDLASRSLLFVEDHYR
ncbi:hypothetical protein A6723_005370 [Pseudomonas sp. AU11447]|nr:hypothetical protein A6723_005370 [Pseudomonas sp. AU11447]